MVASRENNTFRLLLSVHRLSFACVTHFAASPDTYRSLVGARCQDGEYEMPQSAMVTSRQFGKIERSETGTGCPKWRMDRTNLRASRTLRRKRRCRVCARLAHSAVGGIDCGGSPPSDARPAMRRLRWRLGPPCAHEAPLHLLPTRYTDHATTNDIHRISAGLIPRLNKHRVKLAVSKQHLAAQPCSDKTQRDHTSLYTIPYFKVF